MKVQDRCRKEAANLRGRVRTRGEEKSRTLCAKLRSTRKGDGWDGRRHRWISWLAILTRGHGGTAILKWSSSKGQFFNSPLRRATLEPKRPSPHPSCSDQDDGVPHGYDSSRPPTPHRITSLPTASDLPVCISRLHCHFPIATYKKSCHPHPASGPTHPSIADASASVALSSSSQQRSNLQRPNHAR